MKASIIPWAQWTAKQLVVLLYVMVAVSLFGSARESLVLAEIALVVICFLALLCLLTRSYGPLQAGFVATLLNVLLI